MILSPQSVYQLYGQVGQGDRVHTVKPSGSVSTRSGQPENRSWKKDGQEEADFHTVFTGVLERHAGK